MSFRDDFGKQWGWDILARVEHEQEMDYKQQMSGTPDWMREWLEHWNSSRKDEQ